MEEDPLPAPSVQYGNAYVKMEQCKLKKSVAFVLCLLLGLALVFCPQVAFTQNELGIVKFNSSINQAPRAIFFGALAVLPQNIDLNIRSLPHVAEGNRETAENLIRKSKNWIIMVWYGSTYV